MRILVTGGAGFIGSHLSELLLSKKNVHLSIVDNLSTGKVSNLPPGTKLHKAHIESHRLREVFRKERPEIVYHLAAQIDLRKSIEEPIKDAETNIIGSLNVLDLCVEFGVKKVIFISSAAVYGNTNKVPVSETDPATPDSPYGIGKRTIEDYLAVYEHVHGLRYAIARPSNVYGPRQNNKGEAGVVTVFTNTLLHRRPCHINGTGRQTRDFVYVTDVAQALASMMRKGKGIYNISSQKETTVSALYSQIAKEVGSDMKPNKRKAIKGEIFRSSLRNAKARKELGWKPKVLLKEGLSKTVEHFR